MCYILYIEIMINLYYYFLIKILFEFNIIFFVFGLIFSMIIYYSSKFFNFEIFFKNLSSSNFVKLLLIILILVSFFINCFIFWLFIKSFYSNVNFFLYSNLFNYNLNIFTFKIPLSSLWSIKFSVEFFGFIFILLAYIVGFISFMALDTRLYWKNIRFMFICNFLILVIYLFTIVNDLLLLFLFYESMLIPSFLFVYYISPYKRGIQASLYFLIWTQLGSLLVLCAISYIIYVLGNSSFSSLREFKFTSDEVWYLYLLLFLGFGFKVPIWPFQYWLTKTHVEAPAGFSIFLSGFLVKTAIYGFYKITNEFGSEIDTYFFSVFVVMGIIDASMKMWGQIDLKKLVAYGTVQEMNIIYIAFLWGDTGAFIGGVLFCITHAFLSSLMFFLVDCIQRRYNTRVVSEISGILHTTPNLGISILIMQILYSGLPGTLKFLSEFYIFSGLISTAPLSAILIMYFANFFGLIGFSKCWFNVVFGLTLKNQDKAVIDLTLKELLIILICVLSMFFFGLGFNMMI